MKISHEVPLELLSWSKTVNDYEYILPYFYTRYQEYKDFYLHCKEEGRFSILDNGLFEGETYSTDILISFVEQLNPNIFIVPDEWNDSLKTYTHAEVWSDIILLPTSKMVVLQGKTFDEMITLYNACYDLGYRHFALNHSSVAYDKAFPHINPMVSKMMGRIQLVHLLSNILPNDVYIHLLGASLPQEFMYYKGYDFIKSVDTSNPIMVGYNQSDYGLCGLLDKPKGKMEDIFEKNMLPSINQISTNCTNFKKIINYGK